jgi:hypothetical protein
MAANLVAFLALRMASPPLDDVPHRRRGASYPEDRNSDPKHGVVLNQDTKFAKDSEKGT